MIDDTSWAGVGLGLLVGIVESIAEDGELEKVRRVGWGLVARLGIEVNGGVTVNLLVGLLVVAVVEL